MTSVVDICNIGLSNLGDQKISSLSDNNERARLCNLRFTDVRDAVLRAHPWSCAVTRTSLVRDSTAPVWGYAYRYNLPSNCLRVLDVETWYEDHRLEGKFVVTDSSEVNLMYVRTIDDPNVFDALITHAIGLRLASEIAESLTGRPELRNNLYAKYQNVLSEARSIDSSERGYVDKIWSDVFIEARL